MTELKTYPYIDPDEGLETVKDKKNRRDIRRRHYQKYRQRFLDYSKKYRDAKKEASSCPQRSQPVDP